MFYKKIVFIKILTIFFQIIIIDFILTLSKKYNFILIVICKTNKQINLIANKFI